MLPHTQIDRGCCSHEKDYCGKTKEDNRAAKKAHSYTSNHIDKCGYGTHNQPTLWVRIHTKEKMIKTTFTNSEGEDTHIWQHNTDL